MSVVHVITGLGDGGAEAVLYRLVTHDPENAHHVVSLTGEGKYGPLLRQAHVAVTTLDMPRGRVTWRGLRGLWQVLRTQRPDVVQTWMYHADLVGGIMGRLAGVPVVWGVHNLALDQGITPRSTIAVVRLCALLSHRAPARIVACSEAAMSAHKEFGYKEPGFVVIPNGVDLDVFSPNVASRYRLRTQWGVSDKVPIVGMVARFDPYKHHTNLIEALHLLSLRGCVFRAVLVGSQVDQENVHLTQLVTALGLTDKVRLLGPTNDVPSVMNAIDVHVLSSSAESFGNVLIEAMACGTPCVTTHVGDAALIVGDTGWVVPPRDPSALAASIQNALQAWQDRDQWAKRQTACRARIVENFSIDAMVRRYREVWRAVQLKGLQ